MLYASENDCDRLSGPGLATEETKTVVGEVRGGCNLQRASVQGVARKFALTGNGPDFLDSVEVYIAKPQLAHTTGDVPTRAWIELVLSHSQEALQGLQVIALL